MKVLAARNRLFLSILLTLTLPLCAPVLAQDGTAGEYLVEDIRIDGLQRISAGTVLTYLPIERGDHLTSAKTGEAIRSLYKTGFFEDVRLDRQGSILVITLAERPAVSSLKLEGNKDIKTEDLLKGLQEIGLAEGNTFDRLALDRVTQELTRQYNNRGKYNVEITPLVSTLDRNRVNITIKVKEGKAAKIRHVNLVGNEIFESKDIMEDWESKESNWLSWYRRDDQYAKEKLAGDLEKLNAFYLNRGYVDFAVDSTQVAISADRQDMFLSAGITEGVQYKVSDVKVSGDTVLPQADIERLVLVKKDQTFSRALLEYTSDAITSTLSNIGYAFSQVNPIPAVDRENRTVAINLQVVPGPRVNVRRILFKGNARTSDEVLRREMRQFEGSWYSQAAVDRSKIRLQRLGYFESVDVETPPVPGSNDEVDLVYSVKETTSGSFSFGLGYSQTAGVTSSIDLSQNNFLGSGNRVAVTASHSTYRDRYGFSFTNPYFTDSGVSLGYNLDWAETDYRSYNAAYYATRNASAKAILGLPITENDTVSLAFGIDTNQVSVYKNTTPKSIINYIDAVGQRTFHAWRTELGWARDSRNDYFMPTRGTYQRTSAEITLPGSSVEYYKLNYEFSKYIPLSPSFVLNTRLELGYGDSYGEDTTRRFCRVQGSSTAAKAGSACAPGSVEVASVTATGLPFFENYYAGGVRSIRGYQDNTLGPRSEATTSYPKGQPLGGAVKTVGSLEMYFPNLFDSKAARVSAFLDFGNVFADIDSVDTSEFRASTGISLLWRAPVGPISISYAIPLRDQPLDKTERLQFTFGGAF